MGLYRSSPSYRPSIPLSTCSTGLWTLTIGCDTNNRSELTFSSSCRHETVPDVQVITSIKGVCAASWRTNDQAQRTLILYENNRAFCLVSHCSRKVLSNDNQSKISSHAFRFNHGILRLPVGFRLNQVVQNSIHQ